MDVADIKFLITIGSIVFAAGGGWFMLKQLRLEVDRHKKHLDTILTWMPEAKTKIDHLEKK